MGRAVIRFVVLGALLWAHVIPALAEQKEEPRLASLMMGYSAFIQSEALGEERELLVYLPMSYTVTEQSYPVLWVLDGRSNFHHASGSAALLSLHGVIPEMIVVGVANVDRTRDFTAVPRAGETRGGAPAFLEFLADEAAPYIDATFRTLPHRTLMGHSLGSLLAVHAAVREPELFQAFILVSPALSSDNRDLPEGIEPVVARLDHVLDEREDSRELFFYLTMSGGSEAPEWIEDLDQLKRVLRRHTRHGVRWEYRSMPDETHGTNALKSTYDGLRLLFADWHFPEFLAGAEVVEIEAYYAELSQRFGVAVHPTEDDLNRVAYGVLESGRAKRAQAIFELAVTLYPGSANVYDSLGECLERRGELAAARDNYAEAVRRGEEAKHPALAIFTRNLERVTEQLEQLEGEGES